MWPTSLVIFVLGMFAVTELQIPGLVIGFLIGRMWRRPVRGALAGAGGNFLGSCMCALILYFSPGLSAGLRDRSVSLGGALCVALTIVCGMATLAAWLAVNSAGDARPKLPVS